ncbi:MAG: lipocalin family protein [Telmatospirillum sp.]|nr:lipocalin family protein [Telmatospirillum sp.]
MGTGSTVIRIFLPLLMISSLAGCATTDAQPPRDRAVDTIGTVDLSRYQGVWYEIAKYPNWFQARCAGHTSATYTPRTDGTVMVENRCRQADGTVSEAIGTAYQPDGPPSAKLKVRFAPWWLSWVPAVWGDYWIVDLDADYRLAAVSDPERKYLWVLSRTPKADSVAYDALLKRLGDQGFDLTRLETTDQ